MYFRYSSSNGVLKLQFMREATRKTGELILSATTTVIDLVQEVAGVASGVQAAAGAESSDSEGFL